MDIPLNEMPSSVVTGIGAHVYDKAPLTEPGTTLEIPDLSDVQEGKE